MKFWRSQGIYGGAVVATMNLQHPCTSHQQLSTTPRRLPWTFSINLELLDALWQPPQTSHGDRCELLVAPQQSLWTSDSLMTTAMNFQRPRDGHHELLTSPQQPPWTFDNPRNGRHDLLETLPSRTFATLWWLPWTLGSPTMAVRSFQQPNSDYQKLREAPRCSEP